MIIIKFLFDHYTEDIPITMIIKYIHIIYIITIFFALPHVLCWLVAEEIYSSNRKCNQFAHAQ